MDDRRAVHAGLHLFGGMWSVAVTDFVQMIILVLGLVMAWFAADMAGGAGKVIDLATSRDCSVLPEPSWHEMRSSSAPPSP
jgi:Na+/proline symporter